MLPGAVKEASHGTSAPTDTEDKTVESRMGYVFQESWHQG